MYQQSYPSIAKSRLLGTIEHLSPRPLHRDVGVHSLSWARTHLFNGYVLLQTIILLMAGGLWQRSKVEFAGVAILAVAMIIELLSMLNFRRNLQKWIVRSSIHLDLLEQPERITAVYAAVPILLRPFVLGPHPKTFEQLLRVLIANLDWYRKRTSILIRLRWVILSMGMLFLIGSLTLLFSGGPWLPSLLITSCLALPFAVGLASQKKHANCEELYFHIEHSME
jgi:hypothetical protein